MGCYFWCLVCLVFFWKMFCLCVVSLYGWDILLVGIVWLGKLIGCEFGLLMWWIQVVGYEVGLYVWDYYVWQIYVGVWSVQQFGEQICCGSDCLVDIFGQLVCCFVVVGWCVDGWVVEVKQFFGFCYNSDCCGCGVFCLCLVDGSFGILQVLVNLLIFDEVVGFGLLCEVYNDFILECFVVGCDNVYIIYVEVEGLFFVLVFCELLWCVEWCGICFCLLGELLLDDLCSLLLVELVCGCLVGCEGWLGVCQL